MFRIVLVEPRIPQNTGNIARTCAVTGAGLDLVGDLGFEIDDAKLRRAGMDYWYSVDIKRWENIEQALSHYSDYTAFYFSTKAKQSFSEIEYPENSLLVFGREDKGLPEPLIFENMETAVKIPMCENFRSLNLATTVAIAGYEFLRQKNYPNMY